MSPFLLLILFIVVFSLGVLAERDLRRRRKSENLSIEALAADVTEEASQLSHDVRASLRRRTPKTDAALIGQFKQWAQNDLSDEPEIRQWLTNLPPVALRALVTQLDSFCRELNIELRWLVDDTLETEPEARSVVRDVVLMYCSNCLRAVDLQPQIGAFRDYQDVLSQIQRGEAEAFGQQLLSRLREAQLVPPVEPSIMLATSAERRRYMVERIRQAAKRDHEAFGTIWEQLSSEFKQRKGPQRT